MVPLHHRLVVARPVGPVVGHGHFNRWVKARARWLHRPGRQTEAAPARGRHGQFVRRHGADDQQAGLGAIGESHAVGFDLHLEAFEPGDGQDHVLVAADDLGALRVDGQRGQVDGLGELVGLPFDRVRLEVQARVLGLAGVVRRVVGAPVDEEVDATGRHVAQLELAQCVGGGAQAGAPDADFDARQGLTLVVEDLAAEHRRAVLGLFDLDEEAGVADEVGGVVDAALVAFEGLGADAHQPWRVAQQGANGGDAVLVGGHHDALGGLPGFRPLGWLLEGLGMACAPLPSGNTASPSSIVNTTGTLGRGLSSASRTTRLVASALRSVSL